MSAAPLKCVYCGATEHVEMEPSLTAYDHQPCKHTDCAECPELKAACSEATDPNKWQPMCPAHAVEYREFWEEQWREYRAGSL